MSRSRTKGEVDVFSCSTMLENHEIIQYLTGPRGFAHCKEYGTQTRGEAAGLISGASLGQPLL